MQALSVDGAQLTDPCSALALSLLPEASRRDPPSPLCRSPLPDLCMFQRPHPAPCLNTPPSLRSRPSSEAWPPVCASLSANTASSLLVCSLPPRRGLPGGAETGLCAGCIGPRADAFEMSLWRKGGKWRGEMEVQGSGAREEWPDSSFVTHSPTQSLQAACLSGPWGCLPTHPGTLVGCLARALRTVLLGPGGEVPAPGSSHPRGPSPPRHLGGSWRNWPISGPTETVGRRIPELPSFNNLESLSVGELQSKSKGPGLDHQPRAQETVFPSTHTA